MRDFIIKKWNDPWTFEPRVSVYYEERLIFSANIQSAKQDFLFYGKKFEAELGNILRHEADFHLEPPMTDEEFNELKKMLGI